MVDQGEGAEWVNQGGWGSNLIQQCGEEFALSLHAVKVTHGGGAGAHVTEGVAALQLLAAILEINAGQRVIDGFLHAYVYAADGVDHIG